MERDAGPPGAWGKSISVYEYLRQMAVNGELRPGRRMSPTDIAAYFAVSVTPIRDALVRLASDGFITWRMSHGYFAKAFTVEEQRDLHDASFVFILTCIERAMTQPPVTLLENLATFEFPAGDDRESLAAAVGRLEAVYIGFADLGRNEVLRRLTQLAVDRTHLTRLIDLQDRSTATRIAVAVRGFAQRMLTDDRDGAMRIARAEMDALLERVPGMVAKANALAMQAKFP